MPPGIREGKACALREEREDTTFDLIESCTSLRMALFCIAKITSQIIAIFLGRIEAENNTHQSCCTASRATIWCTWSGRRHRPSGCSSWCRCSYRWGSSPRSAATGDRPRRRLPGPPKSCGLFGGVICHQIIQNNQQQPFLSITIFIYIKKHLKIVLVFRTEQIWTEF